MGNIKILVSSIETGFWGGAENFLLGMTDEFRNRKVKISYITVSNSSFQKHLTKGKYNCYKIPFKADIIGGYKGLLKFILMLPLIVYYSIGILNRFKRNGGNIILTSGFTDKIYLTPIACMLGIKVVWIEFAQLDILFKRNFGIPKILYLIVSKIIDLIIVPTEYVKESVLRDTDVAERKIRLIPCGIKLINNSERIKIKNKAMKLKKKMGLAKMYIVGMVSRIEKGKGQDTLIKSLKQILRTIPNTILLIAGPGDCKELRKMARKLKVSGNVKFLGYQKDIYETISIFDVFVFPSRWKLEAFGIVSVEAMMLGVPLVASNFGPIPMVVGSAALLVKLKQDELEKAVIKIHNDKKFKDKLVKKGYLRVKRYDIKRVSDLYIEEFKKIM